MNVRVVCVGKLKERYLRDACDEYIKRLGRYGTAQVIELPESRLPDNPNEKAVAHALEQESVAILKACQGYVIALCIEGTPLGSEGFSEQLSRAALDGYGTVTLVIGSSFGMADAVKRAAQLRLSMSKMTFPHQLARVMLLEQLYRAFQIAGGGKYHK